MYVYSAQSVPVSKLKYLMYNTEYTMKSVPTACRECVRAHNCSHLCSPIRKYGVPLPFHSPVLQKSLQLFTTAALGYRVQFVG